MFVINLIMRINLFQLTISTTHLRLDQVLRVEVAVGTDGLVEVLLLLQFRLGFCNLLLVVEDLHLAHFDVLHVLQHLLRQVRRLGDVAVALLLELVDDLSLLLRLLLILRDLLLEVPAHAIASVVSCFKRVSYRTVVYST